MFRKGTNEVAMNRGYVVVKWLWSKDLPSTTFKGKTNETVAGHLLNVNNHDGDSVGAIGKQMSW